MISSLLLVIYATIFIYAVAIVKYIALHTVNYLYIYRILIVLCKLCRSARCIWKALNYTVIGDCNSRVSPSCRSLYYCFNIVETIHGAHLCMTVKLNPLCSIIIILTKLHFTLFYAVYPHSYSILVCVPLRRTYGFYICTFLQKAVYFVPFLLTNKGFSARAGLSIRNRKRHQNILVSYGSGFLIKDYSCHHNLFLLR